MNDCYAAKNELRNFSIKSPKILLIRAGYYLNCLKSKVLVERALPVLWTEHLGYGKHSPGKNTAGNKDILYSTILSLLLH